MGIGTVYPRDCAGVGWGGCLTVGWGPRVVPIELLKMMDSYFTWHGFVISHTHTHTHTLKHQNSARACIGRYKI